MLQGVTRCLRALHGCTRRYRVLHGVTWCCTVLKGTNGHVRLTGQTAETHVEKYYCFDSLRQVI